jgi:CheY-like chemotaxis protein
MQPARLLVAVRPEAQELALHILGSEFTLEFCHSVPAAIRLLATQRFDLIFCTLQFDSSRMFDLLRHAKSDRALQDIPFVAIKLGGGILSDESIRHVLKAASLLGANACINLPEWRVRLGDENAYLKLREALRDLCGN